MDMNNMDYFEIRKNTIPHLAIILKDTESFPDEKAISRELIDELDIDEDLAWSTACLLVYYRDQDTSQLIVMLEQGIRIKISDDASEVVKHHLDMYSPVVKKDERELLLSQIDSFTTNDMFVK